MNANIPTLPLIYGYYYPTDAHQSGDEWLVEGQWTLDLPPGFKPMTSKFPRRRMRKVPAGWEIVFPVEGFAYIHATFDCKLLRLNGSVCDIDWKNCFSSYGLADDGHLIIRPKTKEESYGWILLSEEKPKDSLGVYLVQLKDNSRCELTWLGDEIGFGTINVFRWYKQPPIPAPPALEVKPLKWEQSFKLNGCIPGSVELLIPDTFFKSKNKFKFTVEEILEKEEGK